MPWHGPAPLPPRLDVVWELVKEQANSAAQQALLGGADRVHKAYGERLYRGGQGDQWQRLIIVPVQRAWPMGDEPSRRRVVPFMVRADVHLPNEFADPMAKLELMQLQAFRDLHGWLPDDSQLVGANPVSDYALLRQRVWRAEPPSPRPLESEEEDVHFTAAEYRIVVESPEIIVA